MQLERDQIFDAVVSTNNTELYLLDTISTSSNITADDPRNIIAAQMYRMQPKTYSTSENASQKQLILLQNGKCVCHLCNKELLTYLTLTRIMCFSEAVIFTGIPCTFETGIKA